MILKLIYTDVHGTIDCSANTTLVGQKSVKNVPLNITNFPSNDGRW